MPHSHKAFIWRSRPRTFQSIRIFVIFSLENRATSSAISFVSMFIICSGRTVVDLLKLWLQDATSMFTLRNKSDMQVDMFKVVGQREVLSITVLIF